MKDITKSLLEINAELVYIANQPKIGWYLSALIDSLTVEWLRFQRATRDLPRCVRDAMEDQIADAWRRKEQWVLCGGE